MAFVNPTTRADGYVVDAAEWNKNTVDNPIALRAGAIAVTSQAANDILYASSSTQLARLAAGDAGKVLQTNGSGSAPTWVQPAISLRSVNGRLSLTSGSPVTTGDVTAATTLYFALYEGNQIALYTGATWVISTIAELSIAVPATTNQMYDVFVDYADGTPALALTAWTNDTTRATALTKQDGVLVKTGDTQQRYVGSFRTTGVSGQTEDSFAKRFVWNYYNRMPRLMRVLEATNTWTYDDGTTYQQANASAANQLAFVVGVAEVKLSARIYAQGIDSTGVVQSTVAVGINSATTPTTGNVHGGFANSTLVSPITAALDVYPAVGYSFAAWLEQSASANTFTWYGDNNAATLYQSGIFGELMG